MKRKPKMKGVLSCLLALVLTLSITPSVFAESVGGKAWIGEKEYPTLEDAVKAAASGDTITLGEGTYSLFQKTLGVTGKKLTFDGKGTDKTTWIIGANPPDPSYFGTQYNGDACFNGADTVIFKNMKLISGKTINVYTDYGAGKNDIIVNYKDCTVNGSTPEGKQDKAVMNINDSNMDGYKYIINISGTNVVNGVTPDNLNREYPKEQKDISCSRLFEFNTKYGPGNSGRTIVNVNEVAVWEAGKMVDHKNSDGYKDNAFTKTTGDWTTNGDGTITRTVTKECKYCGYQETVTELQVKITYNANGGKGEINSPTGAAGESVSVAQNDFTRNNYTFTGWNTQADGKGTAYKPGDSFTLTDKDTVLYAQWSKKSGSAGTGTSGTVKPIDSPKTGDNSSLALWFALLLANGGAVTATTIYGRKNKRSVK